MKRTLIASCIALAAALSLHAAPLPATVKLGAVESLTGDNASYGISIRKGIELGVTEVNASKLLGSSRIELVIYDDKGDKQEGVSAFRKLINDDKVSIIIGPTLSSTAFAADPLAQKAGVPVMGTSTTAIGVTAIGDFIFRDSLSQIAVIPGTLAGVVAGFFGVGGGIVKGPLMLEMGVDPTVAAATSITMILFTSSAASVLYISFGVPVDYAKVVFATGALFTALGQSLVSRLVRKMGPGVVVVMMAAMMGASASVVTFEAVELTRRAVASGNIGGHGHIC